MNTQSNVSIPSLANFPGFFETTQQSLDLADARLRSGQIASAMISLIEYLRRRREEDPQIWPDVARDCRRHAICSLLHSDPFTYRAFSKPRGYAGDAVMMDYIYGLGEYGEASKNATSLGREIFEWDRQQPAPKAVRHRRELLGGFIDDAAFHGGARVLAVAAGHLREAELSCALRGGNLETFVALDQDQESLAVVARDYAHLGVRAVPGTVRNVLTRSIDLGQFDLVYAAGLFDYLTGPIAGALTCRLFEMTRPGGRVLIPNFLKGIPDAGYMESFMDWHLIYRDHADMVALADSLPDSQVSECRVFNDPYDTITYLLVTKAH